MANDLIQETKQLAQAYGIKFKDCGKGHIQLSAHGILVNYWPESKKKSLYSPTLDRRETHCTPWDAVRLCQTEAKPGMKPRKPKKNRAQGSLDTVKTNPAGLKHFYSGDVPPWDESLGEFEFLTKSDELRHEALQAENKAIALRAEADELDEAA